jgi:hypothetical protein
MNTNLLVALATIVKNPIKKLTSYYSYSNRINSAGESLEFYIKDVFCNSLSVDNIPEKNKIYNNYFSYIGNQNNPPDLMIKQGDALEVKKLESFGSGLALNSSYPKNKLYVDSPMITTACCNCENWNVKDLIYSVGIVRQSALKSLWFIYGDCYAADRKVYERIRDKVAEGVNSLPDIEFSETRELGRVNKVDPLGITYLRIRGMWHIESPFRVFSYIAPVNFSAPFSLVAILLEEKYLSFPKKDRKAFEYLKEKGLVIKDIEIKSPDNPAKLLKAKLVTYEKQ